MALWVIEPISLFQVVAGGSRLTEADQPYAKGSMGDHSGDFAALVFGKPGGLLGKF
jgi:hypothetical protein